MRSSSVTTKGQVTIPVELREKLGIRPGDRVRFIEEGDRILIQRQETAIESVFGLIKARKGVSLADMDAAIAKGRKRRARA